MRAPALGLVEERSGTWWGTFAEQATHRKKSTLFWSLTSTPTTSAGSRLRTEIASFQMPRSTSRRQKATFGCRRKSLPRRQPITEEENRLVAKASTCRLLREPEGPFCFYNWLISVSELPRSTN